jgi:hypothetical protein
VILDDRFAVECAGPPFFVIAASLLGDGEWQRGSVLMISCFLSCLDCVGVLPRDGVVPENVRTAAPGLYAHGHFLFLRASVCSNLLKQYLRNIPGGLTTQAQYGALMDAGRLDDEAERVKAIALIMQYKLPEKNFATLSVIISHLRNVADMSRENKMEV